VVVQLQREVAEAEEGPTEHGEVVAAHAVAVGLHHHVLRLGLAGGLRRGQGDVDLLLERHPSLEAMVVDHADEIAYTSHDIDDGIKYGLIGFDELRDLELFERVDTMVKREGVAPGEYLYRHRFVASLIRLLVEDLIDTSLNRVKEYRSDRPLCATIPAAEPLPVGFSQAVSTALKRLKKRLFERLYRHEQIVGKIISIALIFKTAVKLHYNFLYNSPINPNLYNVINYCNFLLYCV